MLDHTECDTSDSPHTQPRTASVHSLGRIRFAWVRQLSSTIMFIFVSICNMSVQYVMCSSQSWREEAEASRGTESGPFQILLELIILGASPGVSGIMVSIVDCGSIDPCSIHGSPKLFFIFFLWLLRRGLWNFCGRFLQSLASVFYSSSYSVLLTPKK